MDAGKIEILLIRRSPNAHSLLMDRLERCRCECRVATSREGVGSLLEKQRFDLVLSPVRLHGESLFPLLGILPGARSTLFFSQPVQDGCWWLPGLWRGANCFGAPAYRPGEFAGVLDAIIEGLRRSVESAAGAPPLTVARPPIPVATPYAARRTPRRIAG